MKKIIIFDLPTRLTHWLIAGGFVVSWLTGESELLRYIHALSGGVIISAILYRLCSDLFEKRNLRFLRKPKVSFGYFMNLAILLILILGILSGITGWLTYQNQWGEWIKEIHELLVNLMLIAVVSHLGAIIIQTIKNKQNLLKLMITGNKIIPQESNITTDKINNGNRPLATSILLIWVIMVAWIITL